MGCYLLLSATLSDRIPVDCFGTPGWTDYIVNLKKTGSDNIYNATTELIDASPWEMTGLPKRPQKTGGNLPDVPNTVLSGGQPWFDTRSVAAGSSCGAAGPGSVGGG